MGVGMGMWMYGSVRGCGCEGVAVGMWECGIIGVGVWVCVGLEVWE